MPSYMPDIKTCFSCINTAPCALHAGSFYANPILDEPCTDAALMRRYPGYYRPNIWPKKSLPELEPAFKALGQIIITAGMLLMEHCDR